MSDFYNRIVILICIAYTYFSFEEDHSSERTPSQGRKEKMGPHPVTQTLISIYRVPYRYSI